MWSSNAGERSLLWRGKVLLNFHYDVFGPEATRGQPLVHADRADQIVFLGKRRFRCIHPRPERLIYNLGLDGLRAVGQTPLAPPIKE